MVEQSCFASRFDRFSGQKDGKTGKRHRQGEEGERGEGGGEKGRNKYMYEKNQKPPHKTVQPHLS